MGILVNALEEIAGHAARGTRKTPYYAINYQTVAAATRVKHPRLLLVSRPSTRKNNHCNWMVMYERNLEDVRTMEI